MADVLTVMSRQNARVAAENTAEIAATNERLLTVLGELVAAVDRLGDVLHVVAGARTIGVATATVATGLLPGDHTVSLTWDRPMPTAGYRTVAVVNGPATVLGVVTVTIDPTTQTPAGCNAIVHIGGLLALGVSCAVVAIAVTEAAEP